jgi:hypothetical protein
MGLGVAWVWPHGLPILNERECYHILPFYVLQQTRETTTLLWTNTEAVSLPRQPCLLPLPCKPAFLDTIYPVRMGVPFPEISIPSKRGQAATTQQEPFKSDKQKE